MPRDNTEIIRGLISNGLDFLQKAIAGFSTEPKHSVINFYAAVELMIKARLMTEHWTLVVAKQTSRRQFEEGDFISVGFEDAVKRLRDIVNIALSEQAYRSFDSIRKHRNKMVHFFHPGAFSKQEIESIAAEQLRAWHYLNQLLTTSWKGVFTAYAAEIAAIERSLRSHREYLRAKFIDLGPELKRLRAEGDTIAICKTCTFDAAVIEEPADGLFRTKCVLCGARHDWLAVECPECAAKTDFAGDGEPFICSSCELTIELNELVGLLNEEFHKPDEASLALTPANCGECDTYQSVIERDGQYLCLNCLDLSEQLAQCEWCSEYGTGDMSESYLTGCGFCEGSSGWHKDD